MPREPSLRWYARAVLFVSDLERSVGFYVHQLGFEERWRHQDAGKVLVAQVDRQGCELILCSQEPEKTGRGRMFLSLDVDALRGVRAELEGRGVAVEDGSWGYPLMVVRDPDGNELYFPYPADGADE
ncbi:MAG: glyoxalase superfamily protein [Polyangiaceae bacterium]|jgi:catechol 2,3-dioxygenase-like lactoylglutathione lyase family enzyme